MFLNNQIKRLILIVIKEGLPASLFLVENGSELKILHTSSGFYFRVIPMHVIRGAASSAPGTKAIMLQTASTPDFRGVVPRATEEMTHHYIEEWDQIAELFTEWIQWIKSEIEIEASASNLPTGGTPLSPKVDSQFMKKIFISHSTLDRKVVDELVDLIELMGIAQEQIFYTSHPDYGIAPGEDFLARIKSEINSEVVVLFAMSPNFLKSPVSMNEMGAAWVLSKLHIPVVIPPFTFHDIKGVIPLIQGVTVNDSQQINSLAAVIAKEFNLPSPLQNPSWERKRNRILERISEAVASETGATTLVQQQAESNKPTSKRRRGGSSHAV